MEGENGTWPSFKIQWEETSNKHCESISVGYSSTRYTNNTHCRLNTRLIG